MRSLDSAGATGSDEPPDARLARTPRCGPPLLIARWYLLCFARELIPIFPVYAVMMQAQGLTPVEISTLLIVWSVSALVFEVPSGTVSDRFSRRRVLLVSRCTQATVFLAWWLVPGFWGYALGFVLWGASGSLWSGTFEALLYESLAEKGQERRFDEVYGRAAAFGTMGVAAALACGGWLAIDGYALPLWLSSTMSLLVGIGVLVSFGNPPHALRNRVDAHGSSPLDASSHDVASPLKQALRDFTSRPLIRHMALAIGLALVYYGCFEEYVGLLFTEAGLTLGAMGTWYATCYGARSIGMAAAPRFRYDPLRVLFVSGALLLPACFSPSIAVLIASCIVYFTLNGIAEVRIVTILQNEQTGDARATVMSLARLGILASGPIVYVATGVLAEQLGWIAAAWIAAVGTSITAALLLATAPRSAAATRA